MENKKFGFSESGMRIIDLNRSNPVLVNQILNIEPSLQKCVGCGNCAAMCTAGYFIDMQFYRLNLMIKRGISDGVKQKAKNCMLCGKCQLTCPRGVNIRHGVLLMSAI